MMVDTSEPEKSPDELQEAIAARDRFLAIVAHELRNPMTPILGQVQRLRRQSEAGNLDERALAQGLVRIERLISDYIKRATTLLDVSRARDGRLAPKLERSDASEIVGKVIDNLSSVAVYMGSPLTLAAPDRLEVICDPLFLEQIAENLVSNAIKYGDRSPVQVTLAREGEHLLLRVRDHGPGIPDDARERIFGMFEQVAGAHPGVGGFGVGLWLVRHLAQSLGGQVTIDGFPGDGTLFTVELPFVPHIGAEQD